MCVCTWNMELKALFSGSFGFSSSEWLINGCQKDRRRRSQPPRVPLGVFAAIFDQGGGSTAAARHFWRAAAAATAAAAAAAVAAAATPVAATAAVIGSSQ